MTREIVLDIECTGLRIEDGHRITEIGAIELIDGQETGETFHAYVNPEQELDDFIVELTGLTTEFLKEQPLFATVAEKLRKFIGDDTVVITCRTAEDGYVLDKAFLNKEFVEAGQSPLKDEQWLNIRRWSEQMYGDEGARLDNVLKRFDIDNTERDENGHGALLDAQLTNKVYQKVKADWQAFQKKQQKKKSTPGPKS